MDVIPLLPVLFVILCCALLVKFFCPRVSHSALLPFVIVCFFVTVPALTLVRHDIVLPLKTRDSALQGPIKTHFIKNFQDFQKKHFSSQHNLYKTLQNGQSPLAFVIACSDSRVDPAIVMDSLPGEIFVVRNVANIVPPYAPHTNNHGVSAALEYAVRYLKIPHIIVMGHASCGGIHALATSSEHTPPNEFITQWVHILDKAKTVADTALSQINTAENDKDRLRVYEQWGVRVSLENLLTFPWVKEAVDNGTLHIHGWYFDLHTGALFEFDSTANAFIPLINSALDSVQ